MALNDDTDLKLVVDTDKGPDHITMSIVTANNETVIENIDKHRLAQFAVNCRRLITIAHEDTMFMEEGEFEDEDEEDD